MDCPDARIAISALLDGERPAENPSEFTAHLAECDDCRRWRESAHLITRNARLAPVQPTPMAGPELLQAVRQALPADTRRRARLTAARVALVLVALAQLAMAVPALILGTDREAPLHVAHEMGSFDMALAVGFLVVAVQPARARGMHLLVGAAALLLVVTAVIDLAAGRTNVADEAPHLLVVIGWMLMFGVAQRTPTSRGEGRGHELSPSRRSVLFSGGSIGRPTDLDRDLGAADAPAMRRATGT
jgi:predicted anti-sigma-YlaC factor YlaD